MRALAHAVMAGGLALLGTVSGAAATPSLEDVDLLAERAGIEAYQQLDQKLQDIGWKLVHGNAEFCARTIPSIGLQLQDLASYGAPEIARAALRMSGDFAVQTAAKGSPAALSGQFARNREIARLGALDPNEWAAQQRLDWRRLTRAHDWIDAELQEHAEVSFAFADGSSHTLTPVAVCATRFELAAEASGSETGAFADGRRVVLTVKFPGFAYAEELLAAAIAHELAHNLLSHSDWRDRNGRSKTNIRTTEREADRLMPWLLANAGYDPGAAARFFETHRTPSGALLFVRGTHYKWRERVRLVEAELPQIAALMEQTGKADWATHFRRDIDPKSGAEVAQNEP